MARVVRERRRTAADALAAAAWRAAHLPDHPLTARDRTTLEPARPGGGGVMWAVTGWVIATWLRVTLALTAAVGVAWLALGAHSGAFWLICVAAVLAELLPVPPAPARVGLRSPPRLLVVDPMSPARSRPPAQGGLWGDSNPCPPHASRPERRDTAVNDLDLVTSVIRAAHDPGYVAHRGRRTGLPARPVPRQGLRRPRCPATKPTPSPNSSTPAT